MNTRIRDQYKLTLKWYKNSIDTLLSEEMPEEELLKEIKFMLLRLERVATHIDLEGGDSSDPQDNPAKANPTEEAIWAESNSSKFQFLNSFLEYTYKQPWRVAIVARSGLLLDILETYMDGKNIKYIRPDKSAHANTKQSRFANCRLEVGLYPSGQAGAALPARPVNLVIAFDGSFDPKDSIVERLRMIDNSSVLTPAIHLLVYKSSEHINQCLTKVGDELDRLKKTVTCSIQTRDDVGTLSPEVTNIRGSAEETFEFLQEGGADACWALPRIPPIDLEMGEWVDDIESSTDRANSQLSEESIPPVQGSALKRVWVVSFF